MLEEPEAWIGDNMHAEPISQPDILRQLPPMAVETELLELFAPTRPPKRGAVALPRGQHTRLWHADAIHRAKNMAQMIVSLANVADHPSRRWLPPEVTAQARQLSRAYDELGVDDDTRARVPCAALLTQIATRLAKIFGQSRQIHIIVRAETVLLPADVRRALVLMGSELIINALKYGYPTGAGGTIAVILAARKGKVELIVEDDGIGLKQTHFAGHGASLLDQLRMVLGATVTRTAGAKGHGLRVLVSVPIDMSQGGDI